MHSLSPIAAQALQAVGWGLLHSLWQGGAIWLLLTAIFRALPAMSAKLKHACALAAFGLLLLWIGSTVMAQWQSAQTVAVRVTPGSAAGSYVIQTPIAASHAPIFHAPALQQLQASMPWLMLCYGIGLLLMLIRFAGGFLRLRSLRTRGILLPDDQLLKMLESLQLQTGIATRVLLRISLRITTPIVIGALRPLILLPASMLEELGPDGLEAILLHELAHISRADYLVNILLSVAECLLFFNPFVWRITAAIRREREHCCDDFVVAHTRQPAAYAYALAGLARRQQRRSSIIAPAATGPSRQPLLLNRIKRIMEMNPQPARPAQIITACCLAALIIAVSIACFSPSLAQRSQKPKRSTPAAKENNQAIDVYNHSKIIVIDSSGNRKEWNYGAGSPDGQEAIGFAEPLQAPDDDSQASFRRIGPMPAKSFVCLDDTIRKAVANSLAGIDWQQISRQMDSAVKTMHALSGMSLVQKLNEANAEAARALNDPNLKAEISRAMAMARSELAHSRKEGRIEAFEMAEDLRRDAEEARRDAEEARKDAEELRKEMQQLRRELQQEKEFLKRRRAER